VETVVLDSLALLLAPLLYMQGVVGLERPLQQEVGKVAVEMVVLTLLAITLLPIQVQAVVGQIIHLLELHELVEMVRLES
jgi:hypothetical protein